MSSAVLATGHSDLIASLAFSSQGTRLATASLDHTIRVASLSAASGLWDAAPSEFKAHDAPVLSVVWAPPEFGPILASGSVDGTVKVWADELAPKFGPGTATATATATRRWVHKALLSDARGTIRALEFAPAEFGLKLAAVSSDSHLRVWECLDPVALADWSLVHDIDLAQLSTAPSTAPTPTTTSPVKGFDTPTPAKTPAQPSTSFASNSNSTTSATSSADARNKAGTIESDGGWALSWCKEAWWGERIAVSSGSSGIIRLFHLPDHAPWNNFLNLLPSRSHSFAQTPPTSSIAWAPASGRSYQLLASGARDGRARVWRLVPSSPSSEGDEEWTGEMDAELDDLGAGGTTATATQGNAVGAVKVDWNVTGTVLSTAGEDAKVRLWKSTYTGQWRTIAVISTEDGADGMAVDK